MTKKKKPYFVYMHLYYGMPINIGKGKVVYYKDSGYDSRAYRMTNRNRDYMYFLESVGGKEKIEVKIVARFDDEKDAIWLENELHEVNSHSMLFSLSNKQLAQRKSQMARHIVQLDKNNNLVRKYESAKDAREFGFLRSGISQCCNGKVKFYKGYKWMFADDYRYRKILNLL